jgi:hypothetical protein
MKEKAKMFVDITRGRVGVFNYLTTAVLLLS